MRAFQETLYKLRIQLIDNNGKIVDSFDTEGMNWIRLREHYNRIKKSIGEK